MSASNIRVGRGVTKEIGQELASMGLKDKVCVFTDRNLVNLPPVRIALDALVAAGISFEVFDEVAVEPTDISIKSASDFCKNRQFKGFVAIGGGSVMDTAKAANLYMCNPDNEFLDFVNAPVGKGMVSPVTLRPLICVPTTAGTGSETTGVAIFDHAASGAKTGIRDKAIRPILGIIDPDHTLYCGPELTAFNGMDVLCHALESYTAVPYSLRLAGAPSNPKLRPPYQGSNPISDIWSGYALQQCSQYIRRAVEVFAGFLFIYSHRCLYCIQYLI
jgi:hydroxyacid-oxoacid transhydrogenase